MGNWLTHLLQSACVYTVVHEITALLNNVVSMQFSGTLLHVVNNDWFNQLIGLMNRVRKILVSGLTT